MRFFIASNNPGKIREFSRIFGELGIEIITASQLDKPFDDPEENGDTFTDNALIKARYGVAVTGLPTIADDSGLCVDALGGKPGVYSARYAGPHGDGAANNEKLLKNLNGVPYEKRTAKFVCVIACVFPDGREFTVTGECAGHIDFCETGDRSFGYDPLFISEQGKFSEIPAALKDAVSHRGKAIKLFKEKITDYL